MVSPKTINLATGSASLLKDRSSVTVSQTKDLANQAIQVTWKHFTPSQGQPYSNTGTFYPVIVAQCKVARPVRIDQCFDVTAPHPIDGAPGGVDPQFGLRNAVYTTASAGGTGVADITLLTEQQNQFLGCTPAHACSVAIIPIQGGLPGSCKNHSADLLGSDTPATAGFAVSTDDNARCAWANRIVVPLRFTDSAANCKFKTPAFTVAGSPMMERAMDQWDTGLCQQGNPLFVQFSSALAEPAAITSVQSGGTDVALTTRPAATLTTARHKFTYAPVGVSAVSVGYWLDSQNTGEPFRSLKLDPRLLLKMITTSYNLGGAGGDSGIRLSNPSAVTADPEFARLNPRIAASPPSEANSPSDVPIVQSGNSDMTFETTRWIGANKTATQFLAGQPDPFGMRVNSFYRRVKYPTDSFIPQDPSPQNSRAYAPVFPLSLAVSDLVGSLPPGTIPKPQQCGITGPPSFCRFPPQLPGNRALLGVVDLADTSAFLMPSAALLNPAGRYVTPSAKSMAAALNSMVTAPSGITQQVSATSMNPAEYPLTMVVYALVPTSGLSSAKADAIARWLRFVAGPAQNHGVVPGTLPVGYLPLTPRLRHEALTAADAVQHQTGTQPGSGPSTSPTATSTAPAGDSASVAPGPGSSLSASPSPSVSFPGTSQKISTVAVRDPQTAGLLRYALPGLLIIGGLAALGGASSLMAPSSGAIAARLRRFYKTGQSWRKKP